MPPPFERRRDGIVASDDASKLDLERVHAWLVRSYWSAGIPFEVLERAVRNSICMGLYENGVQIGFARLVTDHATYGYLCDVYVDRAARGRGLGTWLVASLLEHPDLAGVRRLMLVTRDAHAVYAKLGFTPLAAPERHMENARPAAVVYGPPPADADP